MPTTSIYAAPLSPEEDTLSDMTARAVQETAGAAAATSPLSGDLHTLSVSCATPFLSDAADRLSDFMRTKLADPAAPCMLPSCVNGLPTGHETGSFLSVDLGGSTARVAFVQLHGADAPEPASVKYKVSHPVSDDIKRTSGREFFRWIASKIKDAIDCAVAEGWIEQGTELVTGLSWSFPFTQTTVERGQIEMMGKGYTVADEIAGWDLKDSFEKAARELGAKIKITAIVNDTTASLIAHAYSNTSSRMSLILGTGINACALMPISLMNGKVGGLFLNGSDTTLVNTELSMVGAGVIPDTKWDVELDAMNERPGFQPLECKVSGRYLGEMCRLILRDLVKNGELCRGTLPKGLDLPYGLESRVVSDVEEHFYNGRLDLARKAFVEAHPVSLDDKDIEKICSIFVAISTRSAALTAASLVALAQILPEDYARCTIAYNGTVIERFPKFRERCQEYLHLLGRPRSRELTLAPAGDGSLLGPAIASAMFRQRA
ncbi:hexokinase-1 [Trichomonascus vanleenenianus]|uniref:hexokinase family protein n=1 Tax=Trichomonascus vanleenenianus TaxID=2268995 RepID=UPI003ECB3DC2